ncbi:MAG TPA: hypothetical protein PKY67_11100 [Nitrosomonas sp.]|nr:hypothetical protein [Nitrosomonas sp.]
MNKQNACFCLSKYLENRLEIDHDDSIVQLSAESDARILVIERAKLPALQFCMRLASLPAVQKPATLKCA